VQFFVCKEWALKKANCPTLCFCPMITEKKFLKGFYTGWCPWSKAFQEWSPLGWPLVGTYFGKVPPSSVTVHSKILNETKPLCSVTFIQLHKDYAITTTSIWYAHLVISCNILQLGDCWPCWCMKSPSMGNEARHCRAPTTAIWASNNVYYIQHRMLNIFSILTHKHGKLDNLVQETIERSLAYLGESL
jgi:hypothetical protein